MIKEMLNKILEKWKSKDENLNEKIIFTVGYVVGGLSGSVRMFILKRVLNNIGDEFDRKKNECVRILSSNRFYNEEIYKASRDIFCDKLIKEYFEEYITGKINYSTIKLREEYIIANMIKIYREILN